MSDIVIDTHALIWYLLGSAQLSDAARGAIGSVESGNSRGIVPAVVLAEFYYAIQKHHLRIDFAQSISRLNAIPQLQMLPLEIEDVVALGDPRFGVIPEMHDRLIVITAHRNGAACVTKDSRIVASKIIETIW